MNVDDLLIQNFAYIEICKYDKRGAHPLTNIFAESTRSMDMEPLKVDCKQFILSRYNAINIQSNSIQ